jgi:hypothetical protein
MNHKLNSTEFLRIIFIFAIISGHLFAHQNIGQIFSFYISPNLQQNILLDYYIAGDFTLGISGFFLYQNIHDEKYNIQDYLTQLYLRFSIPLLMAFILACLFLQHSFTNIFGVIFLINGLSIPTEFLQWGGWFIGLLFWCSIFYSNILLKNKNNIFIILIITYCGLCLDEHGMQTKSLNESPYINGTYFGIIGSGLVRGLFTMGVGILTAFLNTRINYTKNYVNIIIFSLCEIFILYKLFDWVLLGKTHTSIMLLALSILLLCFYNSAGIISNFLNKQNFISKYSQYVYSIFIMHSVCMMYLNNKIQEPLLFFVSVIITSIIFGVITYHITQKITLTLKNIFKHPISKS